MHVHVCVYVCMYVRSSLHTNKKKAVGVYVGRTRRYGKKKEMNLFLLMMLASFEWKV